MRRTFRIEAVHHALNQLDLVLQAKVDEVGIHEHTVRRSQRRVVLEEHGRGGELDMLLLFVGLFRVGDRLFLIGFPGVSSR